MSRKLKIAALQMDATPAANADRLERAAMLVAEAALAGAQLVVLPELFNMGYEYADENYERAETLQGPTVSWMKQQAAQHKIHLVGTLLLLDQDEVFNSALLFAPDGRMWRYDKNFPFNWERAYFREGRGITVAETDLGKLGMMICWDSAHAELWERYAGKVEAMLIPSCPPYVNRADLVFPDGQRAKPAFVSSHFADQDIANQAAWMQVPVVHTSGSGLFRTSLPAPMISAAGFVLGSPELWPLLQDAHEAALETDYGHNTKIIDSAGNVVARVEIDGDGMTLAEVTLPDAPPLPVSPQPRMRTPFIAYFLADWFGPALMSYIYRRGLRRHWNARMAPVDPRRNIWGATLGAALLIGWFLGRLFGGHRK